MPSTKSAEKQVRVSARKRLRNKSVRSQCKTEITKSEKLVFSGEIEAAENVVVSTVSTLDKAAEKGIIHANNAARRKSRLVKKLNQARSKAQPQAGPAPEKTEDK